MHFFRVLQLFVTPPVHRPNGFHSRPGGIEEMGWNFLRAPATRQG